ATRLLGLLLKRENPPLGIRFQNAKARTFLERDDHSTKSNIGTVLLMEGNHRPIVHTIDMVTGQDEHVVASFFHNEAQILVDGIGGALVPIRILASYIRLELAN